MRSESPRHLRLAGGISLVATLVATGCRSPLERDPAEDLRATVRAAVDRELDGLPEGQPPQTTEAGGG